MKLHRRLNVKAEVVSVLCAWDEFARLPAKLVSQQWLTSSQPKRTLVYNTKARVGRRLESGWRLKACGGRFACFPRDTIIIDVSSYKYAHEKLLYILLGILESTINKTNLKTIVFSLQKKTKINIIHSLVA